MSHILKTIYKGWNYIVTFSTPLFGGYVVYDIQQIVFNKERQEKYSESRQSKPTNIEPSTTFSNIKNPTFDEKSNIKNHRDESQGLEKKKQQISNIPTASEKENKPTQTQNKIPPSKQPLYKGKSIMTNSTDESQQRLEENTQQRNIIPSTTEREKEPTNKQEQKIPSQQRLPEENKIIKEPPEDNTIPTTTEKETKPTQKQVETLTSKQPMSKGNQIIQKPTEDNDISAAKHQKENARKPFFKCKPYSTYIDLRKFNSIQTVTVCTGCPSPLQLSLQIWRLLLKAMIGYCSQKTVDGLRYLYRTFLDSITTEQESTSTNDLPRSNTTIGIRVCDYLRKMTQMLRFRMYEDQLQLVFTPIVREVNDDINRSIIEFGLRVCDYLRQHLVPFVVTYDRDQRQFVLTIRVEELKYLYQPAIQVGVNVDNDLPRSITTIGVRLCDYLPLSSTTIGMIRVWDYLRQLTQMLRFRMYEDQLQLVFTPIVGDDLNRSIIEFGSRACDYLRRSLVPFEVTYDRDQHEFVLAIRFKELKYLIQPALQVGVNVDDVLVKMNTREQKKKRKSTTKTSSLEAATQEDTPPPMLTITQDTRAILVKMNTREQKKKRKSTTKTSSLEAATQEDTPPPMLTIMQDTVANIPSTSGPVMNPVVANRQDLRRPELSLEGKGDDEMHQIQQYCGSKEEDGKKEAGKDEGGKDEVGKDEVGYEYDDYKD